MILATPPVNRSFAVSKVFIFKILTHKSSTYLISLLLHHLFQLDQNYLKAAFSAHRLMGVKFSMLILFHKLMTAFAMLPCSLPRELEPFLISIGLQSIRFSTTSISSSWRSYDLRLVIGSACWISNNECWGKRTRVI